LCRFDQPIWQILQPKSLQVLPISWCEQPF
jgi:hypothetical protein